MYRLLNVFWLMKSKVGTSFLSTYSTSELLKESQVDIFSPNKTETQSDLLGDMSMLHGAGTTIMLGTISSLLGRKVIILETAALDCTFKGALLVVGGRSFFTLAILVTEGNFTS